MLHPLEQKIASLRRRAWRTEVVHGLSLAVAALLCSLAAMGSIDYLVRFQDRGLRIIATLAVLGVLGWTFHRFIRPVLSTRLRDVDLARQVQRRFPLLEDRLLSAVEFLHQAEDDPTAGSPALRRAVISQAAAQAQPFNFSDVLDRRPAIRAAALLAVACLVAGVFMTLDLTNSQIAVARLANPFGDIAWPRTTHLNVRRPQDRVARGQAFQVEVVDAEGKLPAEVRIHYRIQGIDENIVEESGPMLFSDGAMIAQARKCPAFVLLSRRGRRRPVDALV